ncbi:MAG: hypothetical protein BWX96_02732 [Bacteroidetes bacterium ADurb.Bin145]|nr:MAG: hypothetical protein BWX96_02732 [Bacteroidetes bacterium ADurb.Bin145]
MKLSKYIGRQIKKVIYFFTILPNKYSLYKGIRKIYRNNKKDFSAISGENLREHARIWSHLGSKPSLLWYKVFHGLSGIDDPHFVPEPYYFHKIELILNNKTLSYSYSDKNNYHKIIDNAYLPEVYFRNIEGNYYTGNYTPADNPEEINAFIPSDASRIITKASMGPGGGRSIQMFERTNDRWVNSAGNNLDLNYLVKTYGKNFLIQQHIKQHPSYSFFNETSVNTLRLFTYRSVKDNKVIPLHVLLRIGGKQSVVDNLSSGGVGCGVDLTGKIKPFGLCKNSRRFEEYNGIVFREVAPLYRFQEIINTGLEIAKGFYYHRLIGFDLCLDADDKIKLIEVNLDDIGVIIQQSCNGPLFREYTDEVIDYCARNKKTICFDFTL